MISQRIYDPKMIASFMRTREENGALSNMAGGFPLMIGEISVVSSEHYYQAMRFPHRPDIQKQILDVPSAMMAKKAAYTFMSESRADFQEHNIGIMRHALRLKYCAHRQVIGSIYEATAGRPIVEISFKDAFWGAKPQRDGSIEGCNALGRLHMELRAEVEANPEAYVDGVPEPAYFNAVLMGAQIGFQPAPSPCAERLLI